MSGSLSPGGDGGYSGFYPMATGTNYVPSDGLKYLHKGEAVIPKAYNPSGRRQGKR